MTKAHSPTEKFKKQRGNIKRHKNDLRRLGWVTIAIQLVWLTRFTGSLPSH